MKKKFRKKNMLRALVMTLVFSVYWLMYEHFFDMNGLSFIILICTCVILDNIVIRILRLKSLEKYFFETKVKEGEGE